MVGILDKDSAETLFVANLDGSIERFVRLDGKLQSRFVGRRMAARLES